jgi:hypothetical protein
LHPVRMTFESIAGLTLPNDIVAGLSVAAVALSVGVA